MQCPDTINALVERFEEQIDSYKTKSYNETQVRRDFIDPFFKALGWDIDNEKGYAEAYREVIHEDRVLVGKTKKAPDYSFRVGGARKFFVEAKKPSVPIKENPEPAFQLRRYGWSANLPVCIVTDFEEFAVYDTTIKPKKGDSASKARLFYCTYKEYAEKWDEIAGLFAQESILRGAFDRFNAKKRKGTQKVDDAFLQEIEGWRSELAKNIYKNNEVTQRQLNSAVQMIIDRIVFLRICEDRGIEPYENLQKLSKNKNVYSELVKIFKKADDKYNSGLFHFFYEKGRESDVDTITPSLKIDDNVINGIFVSLYYPNPYEFSVLPADILGHVYEQFLGRIITVANNEITIDEKPEVRKAGGVYYTPSYIVDYIVENTVGELLKDNTPAKVEKLKIVDPACGSGSFLIVAYQRLIDWHTDYYISNQGKRGTKDKLYKNESDEWRLSIAERKRILLNNIFGVDIDRQAVEVTKLSLLLKVLEGENQDTVAAQMSLFHERALPDLGNNIKCGNSLICSDFYAQENLPELLEDDHYRLNVFDWVDEFKEVFAKGGFDAVIGNPPYIPIESLEKEDKAYFKTKFSTLERKYDTSALFLLGMLGLLNNNGKLSYITTITWQTGQNYEKFRKYILSNYGLEKLVNLPFDVFKDAYIDTCVLIFTKSKIKNTNVFCFQKKQKEQINLGTIAYNSIPSELIKDSGYKIVTNKDAQSIYNRLLSSSNNVTLGSISISTQGLSASKFNIRSMDSGNVLPFLSKGQAYRYSLIKDDVLYTNLNDKPSLKVFYDSKPKILIRRLISRSDRVLATYCDEAMVFKKDLNPFIITDDDYKTHYVLAIINSSLTSFIYVNTSSIALKDDFRQTTLAELRALPIPIPNSDNSFIIKNLIETVEKMLSISKRMESVNIQEQRPLKLQFNALDKKADQLVYQLYSLTPEEIAIVEYYAGI